ncbi:MAG: nitroreductase family protein [Candidatus Nanoarchaeia archaeon]|nr:nitroreductase family protein [Candidatus Haiyanarchaeum thermophilum]MCW1302953.1 nitroreductase family protein [Candidatus Haiyanarchaeum thermophilum]MCW1303631.1 nitroreductase family protein [Candidatus Haiyanarchaeum thermophilum]MCW1306312.1 nitroreductase family protein [Candidatus Haiyanarchaeum thermophilum]MCW1307178.1 nitroreductase family protein [Candidatus Haiyanarchaeum thermophilum]
MDVFECIFRRRSVRSFLNRAVEDEKISKILEAAIHAPSSGDLQNWLFILVRDRKKKLQLAEAALGQMWMTTADVIIAVCSKTSRVTMRYGERGRLYAIQNCAAAIENMLLAATALGLGSCWVGAFDETAVKHILNIPPEIEVHALIPIGYPAEKTIKPRRLPLEEVVFFEEFGKK